MKNKKKVLLIHRFFSPDSPPYAIILEDMRVLLTKQGYKVDILSSQPSYKDIDKQNKMKIITNEPDGSVIYRLPVFKFHNKISKILNFFWFPIIVFFFLVFSKRYDVVTVSTAPQILLAFFVSIVTKIKKSYLVYHCMDIHPEIGKISGEFKNKLVFALLIWMDNFTCKVSSKIIVLSSDMKSSLLKRNKSFSKKIEIINNYDLSLNEITPESYFKDNKQIKRVVFTGNIGRFQNLHYFVLALLDKKQLENFELIFVGEGAALKKLQELAKPLNKNVKFIPHQPISITRKIIAEADMGIVSLQDKVIKYAYPSKTMTYLAEGTPVIINVDKNSEISKFINSNNIGIQINAKNLENMYEVFYDLSKGNISYKRDCVKKVFNDNFSRNIYNQKISTLFEELTKESI